MNENKEALEAIFNNNFTKKRGRKAGEKQEPNKANYMYSLKIQPELADYFYNIDFITRKTKAEYINELILKDALKRTGAKNEEELETKWKEYKAKLEEIFKNL